MAATITALVCRDPIGVGSVYFDDSNQVWVRVDAYVTETDEFGATFLLFWDYALFQDQALTITAGRDYQRKYTDNGIEFGEAGSDYLFGPAAGNHYYTKSTSDPVTHDTDVYFEVRDPAVARLLKSHTIWAESTGIQSNTGEQIYDDGDHIWTTGTWNRNGNQGYSYRDQSGYFVSFNWVPNGSGGFTLANGTADPLLPAAGSWTPTGAGTVTFANGDSIPFTYGNGGFTF